MQSPEKYYQIIKDTTLTSIDIYFMKDNKILVGKRNNNPAKDFLFTPGCRTFKGETQTEGLKRVAKKELGLNIDPSKCKLIGVYDHIYQNNFRDELTKTHYVDVAYLYKISDEELNNISLDNQHENFRLVDINETLNNNSELNNLVHDYVKLALIDIKKLFLN